jgi:hypothetical protein
MKRREAGQAHAREHQAQQPVYKSGRAFGPKLYDALADVRQDPAFARLKTGTREKLREILATLD